MAGTEIVYRITYPRADGGENYAAYTDEEKAVRCIVKRLAWGAHTGAILTKVEREIGTWSEYRVLATRRFDRAGREVPR